MVQCVECGPMPNVMAAHPNTGGALCKISVIPFLIPHQKVLLTNAAGVPCSRLEIVTTWIYLNG